MASERFFGQALLESDFVNPNFFYLLAKEDKKALRSCRIHIAPTALFEQGFAKALFTTEYLKSATSGEVKKKVGRDVDSDDVYEVMTKGVPDRAVCAVLIFASPKSNELTNVRFLDKEEVHHFIYQELEKPKCLMQRFVMPKGNNNSVILATWSPLIVLTEGRRSMHSLLDRHVSPNQRGLTFEDPATPTLEVAISKSVVDEITNVCTTIAEHCEKTERLQLNRMTAFFKVDANNNVIMLYSTSLRFHDVVVSQAPVSLDAQVQVAELQKASLTQRFQGLGSKPRKDTQDPLEWMDEALAAADERNEKMHISIPAVGNTSAMLFEELQGRKSAASQRRGSPSSRRGGTRSPPGGSRGEMRSPGSNAQSPSLSRTASIRSPASAAAGDQAFPGGVSPAAAPAAAGGARKQAPPNPINLSSGGSSGGNALEGQYVTVAPGAPLPQPKQLLRYQHVLPNSVNNMNSQVQLHALGLNEEAIRSEWDNFLTQQLRDLRRVRIAQAGSPAARAGTSGTGAGSEDVRSGGAGGANGDVGGDDSATGGGGGNRTLLKTPPPPKFHSRFGARDASGGLSATKQGLVEEEKDIATLTAASQATLKAAQDKAAKREKDTFMEEMRNEVARRALRGKGGGADGNGNASSSSPDKSTGAATSDGNGGALANGDAGGSDDQLVLEDDPRFMYVSRAMNNMMGLPDGLGVARSTLLPPVFSTSQGGGGAMGTASISGGGRLKNRPQPSQTTTSKKQQQQQQSPSKASSALDASAALARASGGNHLSSPQPSRHDGRSSSNNQAISNSPPQGQQKKNQLTTVPSTPTSPIAKLTSPTAVGAGAAHPSSFASLGSSNAIINSPSKQQKTLVGAPALAGGGTTPVVRGALSSSPVPASTGRDYVEETLQEFATVAQPYDDFSALDPQDVGEVKSRAEALCQRFVSYVQDLHYSLHGAFLNRTIPVGYVEIPQCFRGVVDLRTLSRMLHKLHGVVQRRSDFLLHHHASPAHAAVAATVGGVATGGNGAGALSLTQVKIQEALRWRTELLQALSNVSLSDYPFEPLTTLPVPDAAATSGGGSEGGVDKATTTTAVTASNYGDDECILVPLLDSAIGLAILREESFSVKDDLQRYVSIPYGKTYNNALQQCYYTRIEEIKGAHAAMEERRQQEALMASQQEEHRSAAATQMMEQARKQLNFEMDVSRDEGVGPVNGDYRSSFSTTGFSGEGSAANLGSASASPKLSNKKKSKMWGVDVGSASGGANDTSNAAEAIDNEREAAAILRRRAEEMFCTKCNTCRICCVCSLVSSPSKKGRM